MPSTKRDSQADRGSSVSAVHHYSFYRSHAIVTTASRQQFSCGQSIMTMFGAPVASEPAIALRSRHDARMWLDTHCHLDASEFDADRDAVEPDDLARLGQRMFAEPGIA